MNTMQPIRIETDGFISYHGHLFTVGGYGRGVEPVAQVRSLCLSESEWLTTVASGGKVGHVTASCLDCLLALLRMLAATGHIGDAITLYKQLIQSPEHYDVMQERNLFEGDN